jgi:hypothetical protein
MWKELAFVMSIILWYIKLVSLQVPYKGHSLSAKGKREVTILGIDTRKIKSEVGQRRRPNYPPWVFVDNYSYVWTSAFIINYLYSKFYF